MPLHLAGIETDRHQCILWDPQDSIQSEEAANRIKELVCSGYRVLSQSNGSARLSPPPKDPNIGFFRILSKNGDDRIIWDRRFKEQIKEAYTTFKDFLSKGYTAYATTSNGTRGHRITEFNPFLEEIILIPKTIPG